MKYAFTHGKLLAANEGISVPGGHMAGSVAVAAHSIPEALAQLDAAEAQGVDLIKLMITGGVMDAKEKGVPGEMKMPPEMIKAVCDRAHAAGYRVAAHVESPQGVRAALENGVDSIEHGAKPDAEILRLFKDTGAFLCTTISPALPYALFDRSITHATEVEQYNGTIVFEGIIDCAKAALANDIPVVLGNDVGCPWITQYDFWRELFYFHKYTGVSNAFALYTATSRSAELAGIGSETGTVAPGKCADLIVTAANPLEDLRALRHVGMVMARGQLTGHPRFKRRPGGRSAARPLFDRRVRRGCALRNGGQALLYLGFLLLAGILQGVMVSLNAQMGNYFSLFGICFFVHGIALVLLLGYLLVKRQPLRFSGAPWYVYLVGAMGIGIVATSSWCTLHVGASAFMALSTAGQLVSSALIDRFGLFGMPVTRIRRRQLPGYALVLLGVILVVLN